MKKKIVQLVIIVIVTTFTAGNVFASSPFIPTEGLSIESFFEIDEEALDERQELAHQMAECARALGYGENSEIVLTAKKEWWSAQNERQLNTEAYEAWTIKYEEYPYATYVWLYLTNILGYNDYVAAGIIGNMMAEVGGGTLDLQYWLYSSGSGYYYGICQWSRDTYPDVRGQDLIFQCEYLANTIEYELDTFGYAYQSGYKYANFLELTSVEEAALMFAKCYERCVKSTYSIRQKNAVKAYDYFMGLC